MVPKAMTEITPAVIAEILVLRASVKVSRTNPSTTSAASAATG
jgi:hypothetical protein